VSGQTTLIPFCIKPSCLNREAAEELEQQELPRSYLPISLSGGRVQIRHVKGSLDSVQLRAVDDSWTTHVLSKNIVEDDDIEKAEVAIVKLIQRGHLRDAWCLATKFDSSDWYEIVGKHNSTTKLG